MCVVASVRPTLVLLSFSMFCYRVCGLFVTFHLYDSASNECEDGSNNCHENANCVDLVGSYKCTCMEGYRGTGFECEGTCTITHSRYVNEQTNH